MLNFISFIFPFSGWELDCLFALNWLLAYGVVLLLLAMPKLADWRKLPLFLMLAAVFRVIVHGSVAKSILVHADAGEAINSVGNFFLGANYLAGMGITVLVLAIMLGVQVWQIVAGLVSSAQAVANERLPEADRVAAQTSRRLIWMSIAELVFNVMLILLSVIVGLFVGVELRGMPMGLAFGTYTLLGSGFSILMQHPAMLFSIATARLSKQRSASEQPA